MNGIVVVGRSERLGLGTMSQEFCQAFQPDKFIIMDMGNGRAIDAAKIKNSIVVPAAEWPNSFDLVKDAKIVVGFETFYNPGFVNWARIKNIKTAIFPMYEWSPVDVAKCDLILTLSDTDEKHYQPVSFRCDWPVLPKQDLKPNWPPKVFGHIGGNARHNRDGTQEVLYAAKHLEGTGAKLVCYSSYGADRRFTWSSCSPVEFREGTADRRDLFKGIDCLVCPRRIGGHSLPINEAVGEDIPVIVLDLPDWKNYPYKVHAHASASFKARGLWEAWQADPDQLGRLMLSMVQGEIERKPSPVLPSWDDFKVQWQGWMELLDSVDTY